MWDLIKSPIVLVLLSAMGYAFATVAMKHLATGTNIQVIVGVAIFFAVATICEIALLRSFNLSHTYIVILAVETVLIVIAAPLFGEGIGPREIAGAVLVVMGTAVISV